MKGKVTEEDLENASALGNLQNNIVNLLEAERDFREDIASIDRQLVKARQDALKATDQTVGLAKAERQAKEQQVNIEAALTKQKQAILKLEESINKLGPKGNKNLRQKLVEEKKLAVAKSESLQKDVDALDIDLLDIQNSNEHISI